MHPFDRFSPNGNGHNGNGHNGNGHSDDVLAALDITPPSSPSPSKPAGESSSLQGEAAETPIPTNPTPDDATQSQNKDHDEKGRFAKGNKGGPGNPYNRRVAQLKRAFQSVISEERMRKMADQLMSMAENGDKVAARLVLQYTLEKTVKPDQENIEEAEVLQKEANIMSQVPGLLTKPEPSLPLMMMREGRAAATEKVSHMMVNLLNCPQDRIPEMQSVLQHDPRTAKDWLENGVPARRKQETRRERKQKAQRRKRQA